MRFFRLDNVCGANHDNENEYFSSAHKQIHRLCLFFYHVFKMRTRERAKRRAKIIQNEERTSLLIRVVAPFILLFLLSFY